jgi:hypothetical protein
MTPKNNTSVVQKISNKSRPIIAQLAELVAWSKSHLSKRRIIVFGTALAVLLGLSYGISTLLPRSVQFSYARENCFSNPLLLPELTTKKTSHNFTAEPKPSVHIAGYPVLSRSTCVKATKAPTSNTHEVISFGNNLFRKSIQVRTSDYPGVAQNIDTSKPLPTKQALRMGLTQADIVFSYRLFVGDQKLDCTKQASMLSCDIAKLNLTQSTSYSFRLEQHFNGTPVRTLFDQKLTTIEALQVTGSSITAGQIVYSAPSELTLTFNKPVRSSTNPSLSIAGATRKQLATSTKIQDNTVVILFSEALPRDANLTLSIDDVIATDGAYLLQDIILPFKTSGGPKVTGINIGSYGIATSSKLILTFDTALSSTAPAQNYIKLTIDGTAIDASIAASGRQVIISPRANLPRCGNIIVKVLDGIQNEFGVTGGSSWQYSSRTICQTVFSIGTSVQGRNITAYKFGNGASKIIYVGGTHGNEKSSSYTLNSWVDYLEANYERIPAHRTIIVIPNLNPDGFASSRRTNAHNVDLNRNFPTDDWKQNVTMPDKSFLVNGGGTSPLSEPESIALANYISSQSPRLVLTYHATAGVVMPNDAGDSVALAKLYDSKSNLYFEDSSQTGAIFEYDTTGAFEDWAGNKQGIAGLLIELWTMSSNEFNRNRDAMWAIATLP